MSDSGPEDIPRVEREEQQRQGERHSVLAELPRTRPQRPSRRRETARARVSAQTTTSKAIQAKPKPPNAQTPKPHARKPKPPKPNADKPQAPKRRPPKPQAARPAPADDQTSKPTPRQGYEAEGDLAVTPVTPPTGTELVGALAELGGELARSGLLAGGRLLRAAFSRRSGS